MASANLNMTSEETIAEIKRTSSLNNYYLCDFCQKKLYTKVGIAQHLSTCLVNRTCKWCNIVFKNRGNLVTHALYIHDDNSLKYVDVRFSCIICGKPCLTNTFLRYHIRKEHFNLISKLPLAQRKRVEDVWYEKVINSESIVEIKKVSDNVLLMRKCEDDVAATIEECRDVLDLTNFYPIGKKCYSVNCELCNVRVQTKDYKKHFDTKHSNMPRHVCEFCSKAFKSSYFFARHVCKHL